jgi:WD40 repeat protein
LNTGAEAADLGRFWGELASAKAPLAYRAVWALTRTPAETVSFLHSRLQAAVAPNPQALERWIEDLGSERFAVREKANRELEKLGGLAESALRKAFQGNMPLEARQRAEKLLNKLLAPLTLPDHLRAVRAVEVLEHIGTNEARKLLQTYATGARGARLTVEAKEALDRLHMSEVAASARENERATSDLYGDSLPAGAVARLGTVRFRHGGGALVFLPGDRTLLTVGEMNDSVQIWEADTGRLVREFSTKPVSIQRWALTPDGKQLVTVGFYPWSVPNQTPPADARVIDLASGKVVHVLPRKDPQDAYNCQVALSPDGKLLFSLGYTGLFRVEDIGTGKELLQRKFTSDYPGGIAVSPDGKYLAIASGPNSRKLYLWKWRDEEPRQLKGFEYGMRGVAFSPDGKLLAAVGQHDGAVRVWEVPAGRLLYQKEFPDHDWYFFNQPAFTPDGKSLAVCAHHRRGARGGQIELLDPGTGRSQAIIRGGPNFAISSDSRRLAFASGAGMRIYDLASRKEQKAIEDAHEGATSQIIVSPQGVVVTASEDNTVRIWDAVTSRQRRKFAVDGWVRAIDLSADGNLLAASSFDDAVHLWDTRTGRERYRLAGHGEMGGRRTLSFLPGGNGLLSWGDDFYLRLWDMKTGKARFEHLIRPQGVAIPDDDNPIDKRHFEFRLGNAALTPDGKTFLLEIAGNFHVFDTVSGRETAKFPSERGFLTSLAVSPKGRFLLTSATGSYQIKSHPIALYELKTGKGLWRTPVGGAQAGPAVFSADGRMFATSVGDSDNEVLVYEMASGEVRRTIRGFRGRVRSLAFFPDARGLVTGLSDSTALIWDLAATPGVNKES